MLKALPRADSHSDLATSHSEDYCNLSRVDCSSVEFGFWKLGLIDLLVIHGAQAASSAGVHIPRALPGIGVHSQKLRSSGIPTARLQHYALTPGGNELRRPHNALHSPARCAISSVFTTARASLHLFNPSFFPTLCVEISCIATIWTPPELRFEILDFAAEKVKEAVEEFFGCEFELFVEFTGLISWTTGANIGWHSDDNRDYLRQRHFSAVCYLNTYEQDFLGGLFHFQDGELATVIPTLGTVLVYSANEDNVHSVDEVVDGERITMALWFTRDATHDEDKKIIDQLINVVPLLHDKQDKAPSNAHIRDHFLPLPASSVMYRVSTGKTESKTGHDVGCESSPAAERIVKEEDQGHDVRVERLASLGYQCVVQQDDSNSVFEMPVRLKYQQQDMNYEFANILHALQVVQFHEWRSTGMEAPCSSSSRCAEQEVVQAPKQDEFQNSKRPRTSKWAPSCSCSQRLVSDKNLEETMVKPWENYSSALLTSLLQMIIAWRNMGSLYSREIL